jgi:hypothetical protein
LSECPLVLPMTAIKKEQVLTQVRSCSQDIVGVAGFEPTTPTTPK